MTAAVANDHELMMWYCQVPEEPFASGTEPVYVIVYDDPTAPAGPDEPIALRRRLAHRESFELRMSIAEAEELRDALTMGIERAKADM